jgi:hypothetical protein
VSASLGGQEGWSSVKNFYAEAAKTARKQMTSAGSGWLTQKDKTE